MWGRASRLIGVELVEFTDVPSGIETFRADLANIPVEDASVDVIMSRSVFEHLEDPASVYREFARILKPGGRVIFLTANMWDYATLIARLVPNRFHPSIVRWVEERKPTHSPFATVPTRIAPWVSWRLPPGSKLMNSAISVNTRTTLMFNAALFLVGTAYDKLVSRFDTQRYQHSCLLVTLRRPAG